MKPHTAVIIVVIAWITLAILNTTPLYGFVYSPYQGSCVTGETWYLVFIVIFLILIGIIVITSIWTCCFTRSFLQRNQAQSKNGRVIGIFGSLLLVYMHVCRPIYLVLVLDYFCIHTIFTIGYSILLLFPHIS